MYNFQNEYCYIEGGVAYTNTLIIAEKVGRNHYDIMKNFGEGRDGKAYLREFIIENEIPVTWNTVRMPNGGTRSDPMYQLTEAQALLLLPFIGYVRAKC